MTVYAKTGGIWKAASLVPVNVAGVWKNSEVWVKDAGIWKQVHPVLDLVIAADTTSYNVRTQALAAGWDGVAPIIVNLVVNSGVTVYGSVAGTPAIDTGGSWPGGSLIKLTNNGKIIGKPGAGGGPGYGSGSGSPGEAGGTAVKAQCPMQITNNGTIAGGAGGGGGGGGGRGSTTTGGSTGGQDGTSTDPVTTWYNSYGGGGGAGQTGSPPASAPAMTSLANNAIDNQNGVTITTNGDTSLHYVVASTSTNVWARSDTNQQDLARSVRMQADIKINVMPANGKIYGGAGNNDYGGNTYPVDWFDGATPVLGQWYNGLTCDVQSGAADYRLYFLMLGFNYNGLNMDIRNPKWAYLTLPYQAARGDSYASQATHKFRGFFGPGHDNNAADGGNGGYGGTWGVAGSNGSSGDGGSGGAGGAAGKYAEGNANITWLLAGTRLGGVA